MAKQSSLLKFAIAWLGRLSILVLGLFLLSVGFATLDGVMFAYGICVSAIFVLECPYGRKKTTKLQKAIINTCRIAQGKRELSTKTLEAELLPEWAEIPETEEERALRLAREAEEALRLAEEAAEAARAHAELVATAAKNDEILRARQRPLEGTFQELDTDAEKESPAAPPAP